MLNNYSTIFAISHRAVQLLLEVPCIVEEKIDGSQFSFLNDPDRGLLMRSKGAEVFAGQGGMFERACGLEADVEAIPFGFTFRCEYLAKPKHNVLKYDRIPAKHLIVFDIEGADGNFLDPTSKREMAARVGLETVPVLYEGVVGLDVLQGLLQTTSILGGVSIEGVVIKPQGYNLYGTDKKVLMAKHVSEAFKEKHAKEWTSDQKPDVITLLAKELRTEARWQKAIIHLKEQGRLESTPRDIGTLLQEIKRDILKEEKEYIQEKVFQWAWKQLERQVTYGFPEWYKDQLLEGAFNAERTSGTNA